MTGRAIAGLLVLAMAAPAVAQDAPWIKPWRRADWKWLVAKDAPPEQVERVKRRYDDAQAWLDGMAAERRTKLLATLRGYLVSTVALRKSKIRELEVADIPFAALELLVREARAVAPSKPGPTEIGYLNSVGGEQIRAHVDFPAGYTTEGGPYPCCITMHGSGEPPAPRRDRLAKLLHDRGWITVAPHSTPNWMKGWGSRPIERGVTLSAIDVLLRRFPIDADRVVLTGFSMGGNGTWEIGMLHRDRFAGLAPHGGGPRFRCFPFLGNVAGLPIRSDLGAQEDALLRQAVAEATTFLGVKLKGPVTHTLTPVSATPSRPRGWPRWWSGWRRCVEMSTRARCCTTSPPSSRVVTTGCRR